MDGGHVCTYVKCTSIIPTKLDNRLATRINLDPILGPKASHDLDAVCVGHGVCYLIVVA